MASPTVLLHIKESPGMRTPSKTGRKSVSLSPTKRLPGPDLVSKGYSTPRSKGTDPYKLARQHIAQQQQRAFREMQRRLHREQAGSNNEGVTQSLTTPACKTNRGHVRCKSTGALRHGHESIQDMFGMFDWATTPRTAKKVSDELDRILLTDIGRRKTLGSSDELSRRKSKSKTPKSPKSVSKQKVLQKEVKRLTRTTRGCLSK